MMVPSKFLSFPSTSSTTARRSSIPRLMSKEEKEAMIIDSNDDQVEKSNKRYQDLSKKYHAMIKKNQMLAKENAKLLSRQAALKKEKDQLLQVANPVDQLAASAFPAIKRDVEFMKISLDNLISGLNQLSLNMGMVSNGLGSCSFGQPGAGEQINGQKRLSMSHEQAANYRRASLDRVQNQFKENSNLSTIIELSHNQSTMRASVSSGGSGSSSSSSGTIMASGKATGVTASTAMDMESRRSSIIRVSVSGDDRPVVTAEIVNQVYNRQTNCNQVVDFSSDHLRRKSDGDNHKETVALDIPKKKPRKPRAPKVVTKIVPTSQKSIPKVGPFATSNVQTPAPCPSAAGDVVCTMPSAAENGLIDDIYDFVDDTVFTESVAPFKAVLEERVKSRSRTQTMSETESAVEQVDQVAPVLDLSRVATGKVVKDDEQVKDVVKVDDQLGRRTLRPRKPHNYKISDPGEGLKKKAIKRAAKK